MDEYGKSEHEDSDVEIHIVGMGDGNDVRDALEAAIRGTGSGLPGGPGASLGESLRKMMEGASALEKALPIAEHALNYLSREDTGTCPYCGRPSTCEEHGTCGDCHVLLYEEALTTPEEMAAYIGALIVHLLAKGDHAMLIAAATSLIDMDGLFEELHAFAQKRRTEIETGNTGNDDIPDAFSGFFGL